MHLEINKNYLLVLYKLLYDILALSLIVFFFAMFIENIINGFISSHISFAIIILAISILLLAIILIGKYLQIEFPLRKRGLIVPIFIVIGFLMIGNTLLQLPLWQNQIISVLLTYIIYQFYALLLLDGHKK